MVEAETVTISSKGQVTIPSTVRKRLKIVKGEQFLVIQENNAIKLLPVTKLSNLAGIDEQLFKNRKPSKELIQTRREWTEEFEKRPKHA